MPKDNGMTVIVTDHHDVPFDMIDGEKSIVYHQQMLLLIPNRCHVNILLSCYVEQVLHISLYAFLYERMGISDKALEEYREFMAIATVGDIVDLVDENRVVVKYGLKHIEHTANIGLRALIEECGIDILT